MHRTRYQAVSSVLVLTMLFGPVLPMWAGQKSSFSSASPSSVSVLELKNADGSVRGRLSLRATPGGRNGDRSFDVESAGRIVGRGDVRRGEPPVMMAVRLTIPDLKEDLVFRTEKDGGVLRAVLELGQLRGNVSVNESEMQLRWQEAVELHKTGREEEANTRLRQALSLVTSSGNLEAIRKTIAASPSASSAIDAVAQISDFNESSGLAMFALHKMAHFAGARSLHSPSHDHGRIGTAARSPMSSDSTLALASAAMPSFRHPSSVYRYVQVDCYNEENYCAAWLWIYIGICFDVFYWCQADAWLSNDPDAWFRCIDLLGICELLALYDWGFCLCQECPANYHCPWPG